MKLEYKKVTTLDGSDTLFSYRFNEHYHSTKDGALVESLNKYVIPSIYYQSDKKSLKILDICFGLGYNTLATIYYIQKEKLNINLEIYSPEFDINLIQSLSSFNYPKEFDNLKNIINLLSQNYEYIDNNIKIKILVGDARVSIPKLNIKFDIIYQDAFSPQNNPLLWTFEHFRDIKDIIADDGVLTTYSTASSTRIALYNNGFNIFLYNKAPKTRTSTIASLQMLDNIEWVNMPHKIEVNNPKPIRDREFQGDNLCKIV